MSEVDNVSPKFTLGTCVTAYHKTRWTEGVSEISTSSVVFLIISLQWLPLSLFTIPPTGSSPLLRFQHSLSLSLSLYLWSLFSLSNFRNYVKQLKSFHHGWSPPRPSCSFLADTQNQIRPIRATTEISQYPIFQTPQVEEESSSEVNTTHFSFFIYFLFNFWENLGTRKLNLWVPILHCF